MRPILLEWLESDSKYPNTNNSHLQVKIAVIIISHNSAGCIEKCVSSVLESAPCGAERKTILIDNNSTDSTRKTLKKYSGRKNFDVILSPENMGFAKAVNRGILTAKAKFDPDFFFLLNPDAYLDKNCLQKLLQYAKTDRFRGLASPLIIDPKTNKPWFAGGSIDWLRFRTKHSSSSFEYLSGCALLIKKDIISRIGALDERFFLYYEDADFSLRTRKAGFGLGVADNSICYHAESQSSSAEIKNYHLVKSAMLFFRKHYPAWALPYFWLMFWTRYFYHKYFSKKDVVARALRDFKSTSYN